MWRERTSRIVVWRSRRVENELWKLRKGRRERERERG
jgi:hypothetical protein